MRQLCAGVYGFVDYIRQSSDRSDLQCAETSRKTRDLILCSGGGEASCSCSDLVEACGSSLEAQSSFELIELLQRRSSSRCELRIVEFHPNNSFVNATHAEVTAFHTLSAIWSNIGRIAGFM